MPRMYGLFRPLLFRMDAERAHKLGSSVARLAQRTSPFLVDPIFRFEHESLRQRIWDMDFPNPIGLAAGFDKNAKLVSFWTRLGFGFVEVGSVTGRPSRGNPRPRAFRLAQDAALINRMGLNNQGADRISRRLKRTRYRGGRPLGISLAKTHDPEIIGQAGIDDFRHSFRLLAPLAGYIALNISCPNTKEGRTFEEPDLFHLLLSAIFEERKALGLLVPVLVKLSPPYSDRVKFDSRVEEIVSISLANGVSGFIATNTASDRDDLTTPAGRLDRIGNGGLSGVPIEKRATSMVRYLHRLTSGSVPIIGVGGVHSPETAYAKIRAGASLVQVFTGLVYEGPGLVKTIKQGLVKLLEKDGFSNVREAVGIDA
ncbi:MAG TPA: quinone-dependent dihydroorotate dehydrogenase [Rhodothermales bacterium]|nr:quinone-dependent dihydroorotate dehydrogenase [Rhodothermales bacterium]